jgi:hypothetical protein
MPRLCKLIRTPLVFAALFAAFVSANAAENACPKTWSEFARSESASDGVPEAVTLRELKLGRIDGKTLEGLRKGGAYSYVVDRDDHLWITEGDAEMAADHLWLVRDSGNPKNSFLVQEAGKVRFDQGSNRFVLEPDYSIGLSDDERAAIAKDAETHAPGQKVVLEGEPAANKTQVVKCLDVMNQEADGKRLLLDRWIGDNANLVAVVTVNQATGDGYFKSTKDERLLTANVVGTQVSTVLNGYLGNKLTFSDMSAAKNYATRFGVGAGLIVIQGGIYRAALGSGGGSDSLKLTAFDTAYSVARIPINSKLDDAIMRALPAKLFEACTRDKTASIFIRPRMVRIYERLGSSLLYYSLQKAVIGSGKSNK